MIALLRDRHGETRVTPVELFFDLVFVLAVTQTTDLLAHDISWHGAGHAFLLMIGVWSAWGYTAWFTNWFDPNAMPVRLIMVLAMLLSLMMSASITEAFAARGLTFAIAFTALQLARTVFTMWGVRGTPHLYRNFRRVLIWWLILGALWIGGAFLPEGPRALWWTGAAVLDVLATWNGYWLPGLGRSRPGDWTIAGEHLAERCQLFIIIALGESIMVTGGGFSALAYSRDAAIALVNAFVGSVALWWIYFDRSAERGTQAITRAAVPGQLGRSAYSFFHIPMVAGIIVAAAADEVAIAHPLDAVSAAGATLILGGPALYLAGNALFNWALTKCVSISRIIAIGGLLALGFLATSATVLSLSVAATVVVVLVALWDMKWERLRARRAN